MDSDYIKQFLSEESLEALDASKGAQILFVQIPKYDELKEKHDEGIAAQTIMLGAVEKDMAVVYLVMLTAKSLQPI